MLLAATYGKAFGLYGERVGFLSVIAPSEEVGKRIETQMKLLARAETGAMPVFGARIVEIILSDMDLKRIWEREVREVSEELKQRRRVLRETLERLGTPGNWNYLTDQCGMFS